MYSSNFNSFFYRNENTAIYNSLTGHFIIVRGVVTKEQFEDYVKRIDDSHAVIVDILHKKGLVYTERINEEAEIALYRQFYIVCNNKIFYHLENGLAVVSVPGMGSAVTLDKKATDMYINLHLNQHTVATAETEVRYLASHYPDLPLFQLVEDLCDANSLKFANRYIVEFTKTPHQTRDSSKKPHSLYLKLTDYCNLNCEMCGQANYKKCVDRERRKYRLKVSDTIRFVENNLDDIHYVYLWGGEPLLHPEWEKIASFFTSNKCYVSIATNGTLLAKNAKKIMDTHVDELVVSLDGPETVHNKIRGNQHAYSDLLSGIMMINAARTSNYSKPKIIVNCTITDENIYALPEVIEICNANYVDEVVFQLPMWMSQYTGEQYSTICKRFFDVDSDSWKGFVQKFDLDVEYLASFIKSCKSKYPGYVRLFNSCISNKEDLYRYFTTEESVAKYKQCTAITDAICVEANGDLVVCPDFPDVKFGNIASMTYSDCICQFERKRYIDLFREYGGFSICKRCCHYV